MAEDDDTLRGIGISPRERLSHIEEALVKIDEKLDIRFDSVEKRLGAVESTQAGQASIAEFAAEAKKLADEAAKTAAGLADEATRKAADLADSAAGKATALAEDQKKFDLNLVAANKRLDDTQARQDRFDRKVAWFGGLGAALVGASYFISYFNFNH